MSCRESKYSLSTNTHTGVKMDYRKNSKEFPDPVVLGLK
jgi:hypothetical protein